MRGRMGIPGRWGGGRRLSKIEAGLWWCWLRAYSQWVMCRRGDLHEDGLILGILHEDGLILGILHEDGLILGMRVECDDEMDEHDHDHEKRWSLMDRYFATECGNLKLGDSVETSRTCVWLIGS